MNNRNALLTIRMNRLQNRKAPMGELTPAQKTALSPVMKAVRGSLEQFAPLKVPPVELSRSECLALMYAFEAHF
jgi:hypothetical protein